MENPKFPCPAVLKIFIFCDFYKVNIDSSIFGVVDDPDLDKLTENKYSFLFKKLHFLNIKQPANKLFNYNRF